MILHKVNPFPKLCFMAFGMLPEVNWGQKTFNLSSTSDCIALESRRGKYVNEMQRSKLPVSQNFALWLFGCCLKIIGEKAF